MSRVNPTTRASAKASGRGRSSYGSWAGRSRAIRYIFPPKCMCWWKCVRFGGPLAAAFGGVSSSLSPCHDAALTDQHHLQEPHLAAMSLVASPLVVLPQCPCLQRLHVTIGRCVLKAIACALFLLLYSPYSTSSCNCSPLLQCCPESALEESWLLPPLRRQSRAHFTDQTYLQLLNRAEEIQASTRSPTPTCSPTPTRSLTPAHSPTPTRILILRRILILILSGRALAKMLVLS
jgi:hypothetical protein